MLTNHEPDRNIEDLTDTEVYDAIRYLEPGPKRAKEMDENERERDNGVVICVFLYITLLGCLAFAWLYSSIERARIEKPHEAHFDSRKNTSFCTTGFRVKSYSLDSIQHSFDSLIQRSSGGEPDGVLSDSSFAHLDLTQYTCHSVRFIPSALISAH